jgi:hypothetical protein
VEASGLRRRHTLLGRHGTEAGWRNQAALKNAQTVRA